jgi:transcriptional regulator GlxA family with amidase domain
MLEEERDHTVESIAMPQSIPKAFSLLTYTPRFNRTQPVIAVVAENTFTELTDYVIPYGILSESGVAQVRAIATRPGPIQMFPALSLEPQATVAEFDVQFPEGADYVVVPAVMRQQDPALLEWIRSQANRGAILVGICDGAWVLANAGLLDGRKATGHWFSFKKLAKQFPQTTWQRDTRYVADGNIITTTGVTASIPVCIALVEAIAGQEQAASLAQNLGVQDWSLQHQSQQFQLRAKHIWTAIANKLAFWSHQDIGIPIDAGVDEVVLALVADAYSRTYRSKAFSLASSSQPVMSQRGLTIRPDRTQSAVQPVDRIVELQSDRPPIALFDKTLQEIKQMYGSGTAAFVALQLEYPHESR